MIRVDATMATVRLEILLKNDGDRAAGETVLTVIGPVGLVGDFRWSEPRGELKSNATPPADTPETVTDAEGREWPGPYLSVTIPLVTRRTPAAAYVILTVEVPRDGVRSVPIRVTADADELPDDEPEASERLMVRVALPGRS